MSNEPESEICEAGKYFWQYICSSINCTFGWWCWREGWGYGQTLIRQLASPLVYTTLLCSTFWRVVSGYIIVTIIYLSFLLFTPPSFSLTLSLFALAARKHTEYNRLSKWLHSAYQDMSTFLLMMSVFLFLSDSPHSLEWRESDFIIIKFKYLIEKQMVNSNQTWRYKT